MNKDDIDNCIQLYIEVDHDIFLDKGENLVTTANFVEDALSQVFLLYANSDINISLSEMLIWDVPDPYDGISSFLILEQFKNQLDGNFNGDLAHLIGYRGGGGISGFSSPVVHTYQKSGTYEVLLVQSNLCSVDSITEETSVLSVGVDHSATEFIVLYPNPYYRCISFASEQPVEEIMILDVQGRVVTHRDTKGRRNGQIGCDLIPGSYYFHFVCQGGTYSYKVVKVE